MALSEQQLKQYGEDSFIVVRDFFSPDELAPVIAELEDLVDSVAEMLATAGTHRPARRQGLQDSPGRLEP